MPRPVGSQPFRERGPSKQSTCALALLLAGAGVYDVVRCLVTQRTREVGVRVAPGAHAAEVMRMIVAQGMRPVIIGTGCARTLALSRLAAMHFGIDAADVSTFASASAVLALASLVATMLPARRALSDRSGPGHSATTAELPCQEGRSRFRRNRVPIPAGILVGNETGTGSRFPGYLCGNQDPVSSQGRPRCSRSSKSSL
jgi:hypothetical protein